ncbi:MAG: hypothetical protein AAF547_01575 [Actinomycetota bacterium]
MGRIGLDEQDGRGTVDAFPTGVDYSAAVQAGDVDRSLLGELDFADGILGNPWSAHGRHAIVFKARRPDGTSRAIRCFTMASRDAQHRHESLHRHLTRHPVTAFPGSRWVDGGIVVGGRSWPVLDMEWVDGRRLDRWLEEEIGGDRPGRADRIAQLADRWRRTILDVASARIAHGDLQHGNVLIADDGTVRIVDLDGTWVPELAGRPSPEAGHEAFRHPGRAGAGQWGCELDGFPALVIWVTLRALAVEPRLWETHLPGDDHLLLTEEDLADTGRPMWSRMADVGDAEVAQLVNRLRRLADGPILAVGSPHRTLAIGLRPSPEPLDQEMGSRRAPVVTLA